MLVTFPFAGLWCLGYVLFVQVKHAMTMTEKILARASEKSHPEPGENIWVNVDVLMTHDVCGPGTIGIFKKEFGKNAKVMNSFDSYGCAEVMVQES